MQYPHSRDTEMSNHLKDVAVSEEMAKRHTGARGILGSINRLVQKENDSEVCTFFIDESQSDKNFIYFKMLFRNPNINQPPEIEYTGGYCVTTDSIVVNLMVKIGTARPSFLIDRLAKGHIAEILSRAFKNGKTAREELKEQDAERAFEQALMQQYHNQQVSSSWVPACGGTEVPFEMSGKKYLYMWNKHTGEHSHYCLTDDLFVTFEEWWDLRSDNITKHASG